MPPLIGSLVELPGVGGVLRERIVAVLAPEGGELEAVRRINEDPYVLLSVPGIGAQRIVRILTERFKITPPEVMLRMTEHHKGLPSRAEPAPPPPSTTAPPSKQQESTWRVEHLPGVGARLAE